MAAANYMKALCVSIIAALALASPAHAQEVLFQDNFKGKLGTGWAWVREHREAWRVTEHGLEVRIEPGNMWGAAERRQEPVGQASARRDEGRNRSERECREPAHQSI